MARNTIKIKNNGVAWYSNIERTQLKKHISDDNPTGDIIKIQFANMKFEIPGPIWFKNKMASMTLFELHQMGELGKWKLDPPKSKWDKMMEGK
jgi:hypothetical protein|tara:strand:- start:214 stop:492 length:279 start_codon:yes stop_codon:yes gene_type:complete